MLEVWRSSRGEFALVTIGAAIGTVLPRAAAGKVTASEITRGLAFSLPIVWAAVITVNSAMVIFLRRRRGR
jgi:hypothetical protein